MKIKPQALTLVYLLLMSPVSQTFATDTDPRLATTGDPATGTMQLAEVKADKARKLKQAGEIIALEDLIKQVRRDYPGRIIEIELEDEDGRYVYELELVEDNGTVYELELDASSGEELKYEQDD